VVNLLVARRRLYLRCHGYIDLLSGRFGQSVCRKANNQVLSGRLWLPGGWGSAAPGLGALGVA
jgi:hypothetical protein